jgi:DNA-binding MarR family transcriptional regulator
MIERLVAKGLVRRDVSASDRRVVTVEVAAGVQARVDHDIDRWRGQLQTVLARFPGLEPAVLIDVLAALTDELNRETTDA